MTLIISLLLFYFPTLCFAQGVKIIFSPTYPIIFGSHEDDSYLRTQVIPGNGNGIEYSEINYYPVVYILEFANSTTYFYGSVPANLYPSLPVYYPVRAYYPMSASTREPTVVVGTPAIGNLWIKPLGPIYREQFIRY